jgi:hypothetical protein
MKILGYDIEIENIIIPLQLQFSEAGKYGQVVGVDKLS